MRKYAGASHPFSPDLIEASARIWMESSITLVDVQHRSIHKEDNWPPNQTPASVLLYVYGGPATIQLNETVFVIERFGMFHAGKGATLRIFPDEAAVNSYMVLYKAERPPFFKKEIMRLLEQVNPFVQRFGYAPSNPLRLIGLLEQMRVGWSAATTLHHFQTKNLLNLLIHDMYSDLGRSDAPFLEPDPVLSTKRYLDNHYKQPMTFQEVADRFSISAGQLTRLFKKREGTSMQAYLTYKRLEEARWCLAHTNATLKEIALGCGLVDELNLIRMFKRHHNLTPSDYRKIKITGMQALDIDNDSQRFYNEKEPDSLATSQRDGELTMFGQARSREMMIAATMSVLLLLAGCGTNSAPGTTTEAGNSNTPSETVTTPTPEVATDAEAAWPRTYVDATGKEVVIDKQPERIAVLHYVDIERFYALGIPPIASVFSDYAIQNSLTLAPMRDTGIIDLGSIAEPSMETLIEAEPDLIIAWERHRDLREEMEKIAPVIEISYPEPYNENHYIREFGKLIGAEEDAENLIIERNAKIAEVRTQLGELEETVIFMGVYGGEISGVDGKESTRFYSTDEEGLGLKAPENLPEPWSQISLEGVAELDPDHIFIIDTAEEDFALVIAEFETSKVWNSLTAVKNNQVYPVDESTYRAGVLGMYLLADEVLEKMGPQ